MPTPLYSMRGRVWYACQRFGMASAWDTFPFQASTVQLPRTAWGLIEGAIRSYSHQRRFQYAYRDVGSESASDVLFRSFDRSFFSERGVESGVVGGLLPLDEELSVCMLADCESERAGKCFCASGDLFSVSGWGGEGVPALFVSMAADREGERPGHSSYRASVVQLLRIV